MDKVHDTPSEITAEEGEVMVDGPNGHAFSFTADAALETSERLLDGALTARGQACLGQPAGTGKRLPSKPAT